MIRRFAALIIAALVSACAGGAIDQPPEVNLVDIRPLDAGLFEQRMGVTLRISNPNDGNLPIDGCRFALELNGQPFAKGTSSQRLTVPRLGEATTEAEAIVTTADMMRQIINVPQNAALSYKLTGTVFVDGAIGPRNWPFEQTGRFDFTR